MKLIGHSAISVVPFASVDRVPLHVNEQIEIAAACATNAGFAFAGNSDPSAFIDSGRDFHR